MAGSVTKAAPLLGLSQPSISESLAKLEREVGAQLINRSHAGVISLTPAGEYWSSTSYDLLRRFDDISTDYKARFVKNSVVLKLGITPTLRGRFVSRAARIATEEPGFVRFDVRYGFTSRELVEQLSLHQLNCALVDRDNIANERSSYAISDVFSDPITIIVPASVSPDEFADVLRGRTPPTGALARYVEIEASPRLRTRAEHWYRINMPDARPMFSSTTYPAAVDICKEGLATMHCPLSLVPNLSEETLSRLRFYRLPDVTRHVVLAMPKHLMTLAPYARLYRRIEEFTRTEYRDEMNRAELLDLPEPEPKDAASAKRGESRLNGAA